MAARRVDHDQRRYAIDMMTIDQLAMSIEATYFHVHNDVLRSQETPSWFLLEVTDHFVAILTPVSQEDEKDGSAGPLSALLRGRQVALHLTFGTHAKGIRAQSVVDREWLARR